ncbi:hypothetical protein AVEN_133225-1 [Araneus ventricosus]|uniref:Uncharacterized protein n=1 Tax=Araneus ventricosus TaxID=182803 RepID=A0A4Y2RNJ9_ARAVE|nr:hypothetical protein AVEN_133225-1 [Araneus ventricosus]
MDAAFTKQTGMKRIEPDTNPPNFYTILADGCLTYDRKHAPYPNARKILNPAETNFRQFQPYLAKRYEKGREEEKSCRFLLPLSTRNNEKKNK